MNIKRCYFFKKKKPYRFVHESGATHTVHARSDNGALRLMRAFLIEKMYGKWSLSYDSELVDQQLSRFQIA